MTIANDEALTAAMIEANEGDPAIEPRFRGSIVNFWRLEDRTEWVFVFSNGKRMTLSDARVLSILGGPSR